MAKTDAVQTVTSQKKVLVVDDALELTGYGKFNMKMLALTGLMSAALGLEMFAFSYTLPVNQCEFDLDLDQKGIIAAIPFICMIVTSYFWGYMSDTKGRRTCLMISLGVGSIFSTLSSFSPNLWSFITLRVISALFTSGSSAIVYAYIGEFVPPKHLDKVASLLSAVIISSTAAVSVLAWIIIPLEFSLPISFLGIVYSPWRLLLLVFAIPSFCSAIFLYNAYETPKFLVNKNRNEEALKVLRAMYSDNTGNPKDSYDIEEVIRNKCDVDTSGNSSFLVSLKNQTLPLFKPPLVQNLLKIFVIQFGALANANGFYVWFPQIFNSFIKESNSGNTEGFAICDMISDKSVLATLEVSNITEVCNDTIELQTFPFVVGLSLIVGLYNMVVAFILTYISKKHMLMINFAFAAVLGLTINFVYDPIAGLVMLVLFNFHGTMMGVSNAYSIELFPTHLRGMAVCLALMAGRVGSVTGTNLVGTLISRNCPVTFYAFSVIVIACFISSCFLPNKKKK